MSILFADGRSIAEHVAEAAEEGHRKLKCPKCDRVQSATNDKCVDCGHDLTDARKAKFAQEAAAGVFEERLHPRGRGGKFRDVLGKLHGLTPGYSQRFGAHLVTRGHGGESHVFALQSGSRLVHRGTAEEVAGRLAPEREKPKPSRMREMPKPGTYVHQGANGPYKVVGEWRGGVKLLHEPTGTTHHAMPSELTLAGHRMSVTMGDRPTEFEQGDKVRLADGRMGTILRKERGGMSTFGGRHDSGIEPEYMVSTMTAAADPAVASKHAEAIADWHSGRAYLDNGGNFRLKDTKKIAPWNKAFKRDFPTRKPGSTRNDGGGADALSRLGKPEGTQTIEYGVKHSDLRYHPQEIMARREAIEKKVASAEKASGSGAKPKAVPAPYGRPVTLSPNVVPDAWKVEHGYGEWVNTSHRNPSEGDRVRVMPTHPVHGGKVGKVHQSRSPEIRPGVVRGGAVGPGTQVNPMVWLDGMPEPVPIESKHLLPEGEQPFVRMSPRTNVEHMIYHYLTGKKPQTKYPPGTPGYAQWSYGMGEKGGTKRPGNKAEREALLRKITQALAAREAGDIPAYARLLEAACVLRGHMGEPVEIDPEALVEAGVFEERLHPRGRGGKFAQVLGRLHGLADKTTVHLGGGVRVHKRSDSHFQVNHPAGYVTTSNAEDAARRAVEHGASGERALVDRDSFGRKLPHGSTRDLDTGALSNEQGGTFFAGYPAKRDAQVEAIRKHMASPATKYAVAAGRKQRARGAASPGEERRGVNAGLLSTMRDEGAGGGEGHRAGLEGPFHYRSGWSGYYDPKEGRYYDHKSDRYMPRGFDPETGKGAVEEPKAKRAVPEQEARDKVQAAIDEEPGAAKGAKVEAAYEHLGQRYANLSNRGFVSAPYLDAARDKLDKHVGSLPEEHVQASGLDARAKYVRYRKRQRIGVAPEGSGR